MKGNGFGTGLTSQITLQNYHNAEQFVNPVLNPFLFLALLVLPLLEACKTATLEERVYQTKELVLDKFRE